MFSPKVTEVVTKRCEVPEASASVSIKYLKPGIMQAITQSTMQLTSEQQDNGMQAKIAFNLVKKNRDIVLACIIKWSGFKDKDGNNMKCTPANIAKMIDESDEFVDWVVEEHETLSAEVEGSEDEVEKN